MVSNKHGLLVAASIIAACSFSSAAQAQRNPFVPASAERRAEIEAVVEAKLSQINSRIDKIAAGSNEPAPGGPAVPGANGAPGTPGSPVGAGAPGGAIVPPSAGNYGPVTPIDPGAAGMAGAPVMMGPVEAPKSPVEQAQDSGARFIGCINGVPKFVTRTGLRITFKDSEIKEAVKDGVLPACR